ncbi:RNA-binding protein BRN1 isoform X1 [Physcomitrium patens]|uniref:RRM domain-containing protein n=1 Tax=Physcomitrium patens TaxID=3218 RepID=A0A7I4BW10_PHYPA|nr:RNA-binding protein BRN1-like isoform X1 [Physcomitrium patens]XP_024404117.1 RNA-binding protein BRN1-like isoform X1 [Physcomitrium patens]XP_024404118.1 RNA-binding protein BRN1-like isoform X1 [Physcomitrium patens]XP_024404119.1 RNA-binding protein BRN1-like isoform X1 [Physcomitrium patens]XP_024404120.1 RNA-binding protein BRN1-like isoform X1 [Physcomitrium patens]XP_024404121.1 RNA-binding protein BRN1-like isoform X1 [Physcomitrium patens]XP_024404122.1 RNA-binding protein BRN1-l|eukprot:XP_024404116.1 RNA-binding protein BRN1-like isoform X1 [Physcomitrella patens]
MISMYTAAPGVEAMEGVIENGVNRAVDSVKLFVGQLPKQMSEQQLVEIFSEAGTVNEINIIKDKLTKLSRGCCFLTYTTRQEADKAIEIFHNKRTLQPVASPLQVKYADGEMERLEHKLFIGMLPKAASKADVTAVFSQYGTIKELSVIKGSQPTSKGCAFLKYETKEQAVAAIEALNGVHKMEGSPSALVVKWADTEKERQARKVQKAQSVSSPPIPGHQPSIFGAVPMGYVTTPPPYNGYSYQPMSNYAMAYPQQPGMVGLPTAIPGTQSDMTAYAPMQPTTFPFGAQQYPNPYQGQMMGHQGQSYPSPIAPLIGMNNAQAAAAAVRTSVGPQTEGPAGANLFIYHIPPEFGDDELSTAFSSFGNVISAKVFVDKTTGASKCFGFVSYDTPDAAQAAINVMNGFQLSGKRLKVQLKRDTKQSKPY